MDRAYGIDLRTRVVEAIEGGLSHRQAAERFCVAVSTAGIWQPHGHWKTTTFTAGLRRSGVVAPMVLDGLMDGMCALAYVE